jgi:uncharacterized cupin superfamily protein
MSSRPKVNNFFELVKTARIDQAVGIRIVKVTGDDHRGLYVAELEPHRSVTAHYHHTGSEIYQIIQGEKEKFIRVSLHQMMWWYGTHLLM